MKLEQLRYFAEVARTEHVGKAAKALHISPSCISHSISALEKELGRELFDRLGKNIVLTEWGKRLAVRAGDVFKLVSTLEDESRVHEFTLGDGCETSCSRSSRFGFLLFAACTPFHCCQGRPNGKASHRCAWGTQS